MLWRVSDSQGQETLGLEKLEGKMEIMKRVCSDGKVPGMSPKL